MKKKCPISVSVIDEESVLGDTLDTLNNNFIALESIACTVSRNSDALKNSAGEVKSVKGGSGIVVEPNTGIVTVSCAFSPPWHIGLTGMPLYSETNENRKSQQVANSSLYMNYIEQLVTQTPFVSGSESYTFKTTNNVDKVIQYAGLVTLGDGRVLLIPAVLKKGSIYDPATRTFTQLNIAVPEGIKNGILLPDGRVCFIPGGGRYITFWSPQTDIVTTSTIDLGASENYNGGTLLADGNIMLTPYKRQDGTVIYNPVDDTVTQIYSSAFTAPGGKSFYSGILSLDGEWVYLTPHDSPQMVKVSTKYPHAVKFVGAGTLNLTTYGSFSSSVLLPNGNIFLTPFNSSTAVIYNPILDTFEKVGENKFTENNENYVTSIPLPDGRVCMIPYNAGYVAYYDYRSNTVTFSEAIGTGSSKKYLGATILEDGDVFIAPYLSRQVAIIGFSNLQSFTRSTITGMFFKETL
jgi:hypothetical protein